MRRRGKLVQQPARLVCHSIMSCADHECSRGANRLQQAQRRLPFQIQMKLVRQVQLRGPLGRHEPILPMTARALLIVSTIETNVRRGQVARCRRRNGQRCLMPTNRPVNQHKLPHPPDHPRPSSRSQRSARHDLRESIGRNGSIGPNGPIAQRDLIVMTTRCGPIELKDLSRANGSRRLRLVLIHLLVRSRLSSVPNPLIVTNRRHNVRSHRHNVPSRLIVQSRRHSDQNQCGMIHRRVPIHQRALIRRRVQIPRRDLTPRRRDQILPHSELIHRRGPMMRRQGENGPNAILGFIERTRAPNGLQRKAWGVSPR